MGTAAHLTQTSPWDEPSALAYRAGGSEARQNTFYRLFLSWAAVKADETLLGLLIKAGVPVATLENAVGVTAIYTAVKYNTPVAFTLITNFSDNINQKLSPSSPADSILSYRLGISPQKDVLIKHAIENLNRDLVNKLLSIVVLFQKEDVQNLINDVVQKYAENESKKSTALAIQSAVKQKIQLSSTGPRFTYAGAITILKQGSE